MRQRPADHKVLSVFNVITKSGTNEFHASLYEFVRNDKLNANNFFVNTAGSPTPPFKFNQFGGTLGGPVWMPKVYDGRNRTFFFVSIERVRLVQGVTATGTLPRPQELAGDFSNTRFTNGQLITIYDPLTTTPNPGGNGFVRTAFPGNVIPSSRINAVALKMSKFLPAPNQPGAPFTGLNNFISIGADRDTKASNSYRIDHHFSEKNRFYARYSDDNSPLASAPPYGANDIGSPVSGPSVFGRKNIVLEDTATMTPTWLATLRASFTRLTNVRTPFSSPFDMTSLGFPAALASQFSPSAFPQVNISGLSVGGDGTGGILGDTSVQRVGTNSWAFQGSTTKIKGAHELKAGFDYRVIQLNALQVGSGSPGFNFSQAFTQGPNPTQSSTTAGYGLATFLLGIPSGSAQPPPAMAQTCKYYALFLQDSFKVTPRLTLNYGVRWEYETPRTDRFNQLTNFDYGAVPPLKAPGLNLHGALDFVGVNGVSRYASDPHPHNFAPRLGVAYHLNGKTVIRTGGGLFYASDTGVGIGVTAFGMSGFSNSTSIVTSLDGVTPMTFLDNPFPTGLVKPSGSSLGPATLLGQAVSFFDRHNRKPYSGQWSFTVQREMVKNTLLEVGYTGSRGIGFPANLGGLNQLPDTYLALGDALRTQVPNPFFGQISAGILSSATVSRAQLLRPYPQFDGVTSASAGIANSTYHSLIAKFEKRFSRGFSFLGSYTYSKNIDLNIGQFGGENVTAGGVQDYNNLRNEYSPSATDQTHRFIANAVYELPFLRSQKSFAGRLFGGWQASGILSAYSGSPLGITQSANNTFSQGGGQRPNWSGHSAALSNPTVNRWFDTSQFTVAAPYQFGNVARTLGGLRSQGVKGLDFTLSKATVIHEQFRLQFRAEIFNLTNTPIFGIPNTSLGAAAFGTINSQNNQPRIIQFALKFLF